MKKKFILALLVVTLVAGAAGADSTLPVSFDLRATDVVPPIRNQMSWGTCWAFAAIAACETNYLTQVKNGAENFMKVESQDIGLSPMHLAWYARMAPKRYQRFTTTIQVEKNGKTVRRKVDNPTGVQVLNNGGWDYMSAAVMSRGVGWGPVLSEDCPYIGSDPSNTYQGIMKEKDWNWTDNEAEIEEEFKERTNEWCKDNMKKNQDAYKSVLRLTDASFLTKPNSDLMFTEHRDELKRLIMEKGALNLTYYSAADKRFYGSGAYLYTDKTKSKNKRDTQSTLDPRQSINHVVALIGWDDEFPVEKFTGPEKPSKPGAWLVRNSWGRSEYKDYFWISYEQYLTSGAAFTMEKPNPTLRAYLYDDLGLCSRWGGSEEASAANVFQVKSDGEALNEVAFYTTRLNTTVSVTVYDYGTEHPDDQITDGTILASVTNQKYPLPGYHTLKLDAPVDLRKGDYFGVVLKVENPDGEYYPIAVEKRMKTYSDYARAEDGESYFLLGEEWEDGAFHKEKVNGRRVVTPMNACIRAFTIDPTYEEEDEEEKKKKEEDEDEDDDEVDEDDSVSGVKVENYPTVTVSNDGDILLVGRQVSVTLVSNDKKPLPRDTKAKMYFVLVEEDWDEDDEPDETLSSAVSLAGLHEATVPHSGIPTGHRQPDLPNAAKLAASRKPGSLAGEDDDEDEHDHDVVMDDDFVEESFDVDPFYTVGFKPDRIFVEKDGMSYPVYGPREVTVGEGGAVTLDADKENLPEGFYNVLYVAGAVTGDLPVVYFAEGGVPEDDEDDKYWDDEGTKPTQKKSHGGCDAGIAGGLTFFVLAGLIARRKK